MFDTSDAIFLGEEQLIASDNHCLPSVQRRLGTARQPASIPINDIGQPGASIPRAHWGLNQVGRAAVQIDDFRPAKALPQIKEGTSAAQGEKIIRLAGGP